MSKKNIRLLALGFLLSSLLLLTLNGLAKETNASENESTEELEAKITFLEERAASLELENEKLLTELNGEEPVETEEAPEEEPVEEETPEEEQDLEEDEGSDSEEDDTVEEEPEEETITTYTIVVNENEPSSVIADQLLDYGLIDDRVAFNGYLEDSGAYLRVRAGSYTVSSDMNREQLVDAIIN